MTASDIEAISLEVERAWFRIEERGLDLGAGHVGVAIGVHPGAFMRQQQPMPVLFHPACLSLEAGGAQLKAQPPGHPFGNLAVMAMHLLAAPTVEFDVRDRALPPI